MEDCHACKRALEPDVGGAAVLCTGGCGRLFHAGCTSLAALADVSAYLCQERRWKCRDCEEKCPACSDGFACGAYAGVVKCGGGCDGCYHAKCTDLCAAADLRQYLSDRQAWICENCRGRKSKTTRPETSTDPSAAARVKRSDVDAICQSMLEVEKCLEQFSRKLELFEKDVMSVNGCVKVATEEMCKNNAESKQVSDKIEQLSTEVERAAVTVLAADRQVNEGPGLPHQRAETESDVGGKDLSVEVAIQAENGAGVGRKDLTVEVAINKIASRREKSLSLGGRRRNGQVPHSQQVPVLYRLTKQFARDNDYGLVWIHHADVFLRKRPGSSARKVKHKDDLLGEDTPVSAVATQAASK